jgi:hypothetical protein
MSRKSKKKKSKVPKEKGIHMQVSVSSGVGLTDLMAITIPENKPGAVAPLELGIGFSNNTSFPFPLLVYGGLMPELVASNGQVLKPQEPTDGKFGTQRHHWSIITPGGIGTGITLKGRLYWRNSSLHLEIPTHSNYWGTPNIPENSWTFDGLQVGNYQLRFTYESPSREVLSFIPEISEIADLGVITTQKLTTAYINLRLVEPLETDKNCVEVDGIRFETLVPEAVLNIPIKECGTQVGVELAGIRITNNTLNPTLFSFYATVKPEMIGTDGQVLFRGYFSDWLRQVEKSDFVWLQPGENYIFSLETSIWWQENDQIKFVIEVGDGGCHTFLVTNLGTYKIQLNYINAMALVNVYDQETREWKKIENIWTGMVTTPFVEFRLTRV